MAGSLLRVAIVGGGLAGTILMNALIKHPHLDIRIYEASPELKERGASIGLARNARRAMQLIGLGDVVKRAHGVRVGSSSIIMGEGPEAGTVVRDADFDTQTVHRAALLRELLAGIPKDRIHLSKRLSSIQGSTINFEDNTSAVADVIIGADGIRSAVRKYVLGKEHPAIEPVSAGFWDTRSVVSYDEAVARLGNSCINKEDPRQHMHIGVRGVLFHDIIDNAERVCIVASGPVPEDWDRSQWKHTVSRPFLDSLYTGWGELGRNGLDLLCGDNEELSAFMQWESAKIPKLYNGTTCVIGDAAHAATPWLGSGLSQAIEDALILERLLARCNRVQEVSAAFEAFDRVRRTHAQRVVDSSRKVAETFFGANGLDAKKVKNDIPSREFVHDWDTEGAIEQAVHVFEQVKKPAAQVVKLSSSVSA